MLFKFAWRVSHGRAVGFEHRDVIGNRIVATGLVPVGGTHAGCRYGIPDEFVKVHQPTVPNSIILPNFIMASLQDRRCARNGCQGFIESFALLSSFPTPSTQFAAHERPRDGVVALDQRLKLDDA
jgi:hypothetical protein